MRLPGRTAVRAAAVDATHREVRCGYRARLAPPPTRSPPGSTSISKARPAIVVRASQSFRASSSSAVCRRRSRSTSVDAQERRRRHPRRGHHRARAVSDHQCRQQPHPPAAGPSTCPDPPCPDPASSVSPASPPQGRTGHAATNPRRWWDRDLAAPCRGPRTSGTSGHVKTRAIKPRLRSGQGCRHLTSVGPALRRRPLCAVPV